MDGARFDDLTRSLSRVQTRRHLLAGLAGGMAAFAGLGRAAGATCREADRTCTKDAHCCSGLCGQKDATGRRRCVCPDGTTNCGGVCLDAGAFASDPENCGGCATRCPHTRCTMAVCVQGQCGLAPNPKTGRISCDDGDACTRGDVCQADGTCAGVATDCSGLNDPCHAGVCDPKTGDCVKQRKSDGTACDDGNPCTSDTTCQAGVCAGTTSDCSSLDDACNTGICRTSDGVCVKEPKSNGIDCDDGNACTSNTTCQAGVCTGGISLDPCSTDPFGCLTGGQCDPATGTCAGQEPKSDGTPCAGGTLDPCSSNACQAGTCVAQPKDCSALADACHDGICDQNTGECRTTPKPAGNDCTVEDDCGGTHAGTCQGGTCVRTDPPNCPANNCVASYTCAVIKDFDTCEVVGINECVPATYLPPGTHCGYNQVCERTIVLGGNIDLGCGGQSGGSSEPREISTCLWCRDGFFKCDGLCVPEWTVCCDNVICDYGELCCPGIDNRECKRPAPIIGGCPLF